MNTSESISHFMQLLSACEVPRQWENGRLSLKLQHQITAQLLQALELADFIVEFDQNDLDTAFQKKKLRTLVPGTAMLLQVPKIASKLSVVSSLDELLGLPGVQNGDLAPCVICGELYAQVFDPHSAINAATQELHYLTEVISFWHLLKRLCDHEQGDGSLLFFGIRRVEITSGFTRDALAPSQIPEILKFTHDLDREEVRKEIFKSMLMELLVEQKPENAFQYLLSNSKLFGRRLKEGLAIYLSERSPKKLQREAEDKALGYTEKLDKLLTAMEAKSFTIPAALLLAYKEVVPGNPIFTGANLVVLITTLLYLVTMIWSHSTQKELISQLSRTVTAFKQDLKGKGLDYDNPVLESVCPSLEKRINRATGATWVMCICAALPLVVALLHMHDDTPSQKADSVQQTKFQAKPLKKTATNSVN